MRKSTSILRTIGLYAFKYFIYKSSPFLVIHTFRNIQSNPVMNNKRNILKEKVSKILQVTRLSPVWIKM